MPLGSHPLGSKPTHVHVDQLKPFFVPLQFLSMSAIDRISVTVDDEGVLNRDVSDG